MEQGPRMPACALACLLALAWTGLDSHRAFAQVRVGVPIEGPPVQTGPAGYTFSGNPSTAGAPYAPGASGASLSSSLDTALDTPSLVHETPSSGLLEGPGAESHSQPGPQGDGVGTRLEAPAGQTQQARETLQANIEKLGQLRSGTPENPAAPSGHAVQFPSLRQRLSRYGPLALMSASLRDEAHALAGVSRAFERAAGLTLEGERPRPIADDGSAQLGIPPPSLLTSSASPPRAARAQGGLSHVEIRELKRYGGRDRGSRGTLLTPPRGRLTKDVRQAQEYVASIVERLAGDRLRREKINLRINLYAADSINAFAQEESPAKATPEREWKSANDAPWPIRRFLEFKDDGSSLYELGIHTGLLRRLESESELAFLLAHELTHIFEKHLPTEESRSAQLRHWWSSQRHEALADRGALDLMLGKFELDETLRILDNLSRGAEPSGDLWDAAFAAISTHHHEGVRLSLAQGYVEYLRRTSPAAQPREPGALPAFLKLRIPGRERWSIEGFDDFQEGYRSIIQDYFLQGRHFFWLWDRLFPPHPEPQELQVLRKLSWSALRAESHMPGFFLAGFRQIRASRESPQRKVDAFLYHLAYTNRRFRPYLYGPDVLGLLDDQSISEVLRFLAENSAGRASWRLKPFLEHLTVSLDGEAFPWDALFARSRNAQRVLASLARVFPEWNQLLEGLPELAFWRGRRQAGGDPDFPQILGMITHLADERIIPDGPVAQGLKRSVLDLIRREPPETWLPGPRLFDRPDIRFLLDAQLYNPGPRENPFLLEASQALRPVFQRFIRLREDATLRLFREPFDTPYETGRFLQDLAYSFQALPPAPGFLRRFEAPLMAFIRHSNHREHFGSNSTLNAPLFGYVVRLLASPKRSRQDQREILQFLAASYFQGSSITGDRDTPEIHRYLLRAVHRLTKEQFLRLFYRPYESGHERRRKLEAQWVRLISSGNIRDFPLDALHQIDAVIKAARSHFLTFAGFDRAYSQAFARQFALSDLDDILAALRQPIRRDARALLGSEDDTPHLSDDATRFLMDIFVGEYKPPAGDRRDGGRTLARWLATYRTILGLNPHAWALRHDYKERLESFLAPRLEALPWPELGEWLMQVELLKVLRPQTAARLLARVLELKGNRQPAEVRIGVDQFQERLKLETEHPVVYQYFQEELAERIRLQPHELGQIFPASALSATERAGDLSTEIRGLSGLVALTRGQATQTQIQMIEYLMGREENIPAFLTELVSDSPVPFLEVVKSARSQLDRAPLPVRVLAANSFLAGPSSFIEKAEGLAELLAHLLRPVRSERLALARTLAKALLDSRGRKRSLALAYVLGQRADTGAGLSESALLRSLFNAYGAPGIKLAQYLAFTAEFAEYHEALESAQDAALPISYLQLLDLLLKRFGDAWPRDLRITHTLGSGAVNIAVEYVNPETGQLSAFTVPRDEIETTTREDFRNFDRFLEALTARPEERERFGYLLGLSRIIRKSVALEFDRQSAFERQKDAQRLYNRTVNGWRVRTVDASRLENLAVFMEKAPGQGARTVYRNDPQTYREAMAALQEVELDILLGVSPSERAQPMPLIANPDLHDGQVFIDGVNRTVTILDFGQALVISNGQREAALDLLRVIGRVESPSAAARLVNAIVRGHGGTTDLINEGDMRLLNLRSDRIDIFIHLLSLLSVRGFEIPLPTVHWILAINRQAVLGAKIGRPLEGRLRRLVLARRFGVSLRNYNRLRSIARW